MLEGNDAVGEAVSAPSMASYADPAPVATFAGQNVWTAASDGQLEIVRVMIDSGAHRADEGDAQGYTCLHAASSYGHHDLLRYLLAQVAVDVNCKDEDGDSPLHVCEDVETAKILLDAGADPGAPNGAGQVPYEVAAEEERSEVAQYLADAHPGYARAGLTRPNLAGVTSGPDCESMTVTIEELAKACGEDGTVDVQMAMDQAQDGKRRRV